MSDALREQGNTAFKEGKWEAAIDLYTQAIKEDPKDFKAISNRSAAYLKHAHALALATSGGTAAATAATAATKAREDALEDARLLVRLKPKWQKSQFRLAQALEAVGELREALAIARECRRLACAGGGEGRREAQALVLRVEREWIAAYYGPLCAGAGIAGSVRVGLCADDAAKGKGVFSARAFDEGECVFQEAPLVSHIESSAPEKLLRSTCAHCMRPLITREVAAELLDPALSPIPRMACGVPAALARALETPRELVPCPHCAGAEAYCSEACRDAAWRGYHKLLCTRGNKDGPMATFGRMARATGLTNPQCIARMMAACALRVTDGGMKLTDALAPFMAFEWSSWPSERDDEFFALLYKALAPQVPPGVAAGVVSLEVFRIFNGVLQRNASRVQPLTDVHLLLSAEAAASEKDVLAALSSPWASHLSAGGTALFAVANTINHSCAPNAQFASATTDHKITVVCTSKISPNDEVTVSYIDETQPKEKRIEELKSKYLFTCQCEKCRK